MTTKGTGRVKTDGIGSSNGGALESSINISSAQSIPEAGVSGAAGLQLFFGKHIYRLRAPLTANDPELVHRPRAGPSRAPAGEIIAKIGHCRAHPRAAEPSHSIPAHREADFHAQSGPCRESSTSGNGGTSPLVCVLQQRTCPTVAAQLLTPW